MLTLIVILLEVAIVSFAYGDMVMRAFGALTPFSRSDHPTFAVVTVVGLAMLSALTAAASFAAPINSRYELAVTAVAIAYVVVSRRAIATSIRRDLDTCRHAGIPILLLVVAVEVMGLVLGAWPASNYDTGLYHAQAIRWLEELGTVPGLANLHDRFGLNSSWFTLEALFATRRGGGAVTHGLTCALLLILLPWWLMAIAPCQEERRRLVRAIRIALVPAALAVLWYTISSPGTDAAAAMLVWAGSIVFLEKQSRRTAGERNAWSISCAAIVVFAVTVKPSVAPLILLPLGMVLAAAVRRRFRVAISVLLCCSVLLVPYLARSVALTGYLVYNVPALDLFSVDWKVPAEHVRELNAIIKSWARIPGQGPAAVIGLPVTVWGPLWWGRLGALDRAFLIEIVVLTPIAASLALWCGARARNTAIRTNSAQLAAILYVGLVAWLVTVPEPRFGWGFVVLLAIYLAFATVHVLVPSATVLTAVACCLIGMAVLGADMLRAESWALFRQTLVVRPAYPAANVKVEAGGNFDTRVPVTEDQCWYVPLPCTPYPNFLNFKNYLNPRGAPPGHRGQVELRNGELSGGFRLRLPRDVP